MSLQSLTAQDSLLNRQVTIHETQCTLEAAIKIIELQTGLSFSYNSGLFDRRKEVTISASGESLMNVLVRLFDDPTLNYGIIGRHLVVYRPVKTQTINPESSVDSVYYFTISGKVFDRDNRQPLPFSTVYLVGKTVGTISNEEGEFQLKLTSGELSETLSISCMGYKNFSSPVSALINTNQNYFLETDIISIQEVIIRKVSPELLLRNANARIKDNYPNEPAVLTSFYRETVQRGIKYTMVSEAILDIFKSGYKNMSSDKVKIVKGRKNEEINREDSVMLKLKAGLSTMLMLDVVKNMPDFLTGESLSNYHYRLSDIVVEDGRDHYAVEFTPTEGAAETIYSGRILIDINDMAFKWIDFQVNPAQLEQATRQFIIRKPTHLVVKALKANYKVAFRKTGNKYYLHLINCETSFKIRNKHQLTGTIYNTNLEMVVIDIDTVNVNRFSQREVAHPYEFFSDQLGVYDESFWGEYNFITPDGSLENALAKLKKAQATRKE
jgi:hypothetical protein